MQFRNFKNSHSIEKKEIYSYNIHIFQKNKLIMSKNKYMYTHIKNYNISYFSKIRAKNSILPKEENNAPKC